MTGKNEDRSSSTVKDCCACSEKHKERSPEEYRDLVVRVAGFSAYFVELSEGSQRDVISRTEMSI